MLLEILEIYNYEPQLAMPGPMVALAIGGAIMQGVSGLMANGKANGMNSQIEGLQSDLDSLVAGRQEIPDISDSLTDMSSSLSNPYANLGVATQGAKIQMEQTDLALANTLDTIAQAGLGAGGATALAREAARSKNKISASIEQQEVQNEKLKAQGSMQLQQQILAEKVRMQQGEIAAQQFMYTAQETRTNSDLDRAAGLLDNALAQQAQYSSDSMTAFGNMGGSLISAGLNG
jgi:hypothetical protein